MTRSHTPSDASIHADFDKRISRLFIFRFLLVFIMIWPLYVWMIWIQLLSIFHFFYMLILGKRHEGIWKRKMRFMRHMTKWQMYLMAMTDKRPKFIED